VRRSIRSGAAIVALMALLGACGSEYKGLTKTEFLERANQTCTHPTKAGQDLKDLLAVELDQDKKAKLWLDKVLPRLEREVDRIADLKPPKADRDAIKKILDMTRSEIDTYSDFLHKDPEAALAAGAKPFEQSTKAATEYGLKICVS
jgi:hypothetical protein